MTPDLTEKEAEILEALAERRGFHLLHKIGRKYYDSLGQRVYDAWKLNAVVRHHKSKREFLKFLLSTKYN